MDLTSFYFSFIYPVLRLLSDGLLNLSAWQIMVATLLMTQVTIAAVTIYLHRCMAHRAVDLHPVVSHFFRFWLWLTTGMKTNEWTGVHRKHHAKCETAEDPHSPVTRGLATVLREGAELYKLEATNPETLEKYTHGCPDDWIERHVYGPYSIAGIGLMLVINVLLFGFAGFAVWAVQMAWIPVNAAGIINGIGHAKGYRNYDSPDASTNIVPWGIFIGGEELHNNHHAFGSSAKFSTRWFEVDIGWGYITVMRWLGLAKVRKVAPVARLGAARSGVDMDLVHAVINHRYDLMAAYARSLRKAMKEEAAKIRESHPVQSARLATMRRWVATDASLWTQERRAGFAEAIAANENLSKLVEMRVQLAQVWERSHASRDQLVVQLQEWVAAAEASGLQSLQELSVRVRRYAM
jgi:stearoyl-CoA desaturase (Delta-9 desaturase)